MSVLRSILASKVRMLVRNGTRLAATQSRSFVIYPALGARKTVDDANSNKSGLFAIQPDNKEPTNHGLEKDYERVSNETLESLTERFDHLSDELADLLSDDFDCTFSNGVLTLKLGGHLGTYVVNKQTPNLQIWLSSPTSGPKRFDFIEDTWVYKRTGETLHNLLETELSKCFNRPIDLSSCAFSPKHKTKK